jgi:hypothetical protein
MLLMKFAAAILGGGAAVGLAGCISPAEQYQRDVSQCKSYDFSAPHSVTTLTPDGGSGGTDTATTDAFANCMMTLSQQRELRRTIIESEPTPTYTPPQPYVSPADAELKSGLQAIGRFGLNPP